MKRWAWIGFLTIVVIALRSRPASAQAPTARNAGEFETHASRATTDETRFRLQVGASLATGNTRSFAGNFAGRFLLRRGNSQLTIDGAVNYGRAAVAATDAMTGMRRFGPDQTTAENYLLRARFDRFFLQDNSLYIGVLAFRDQPSGFNSRLSGQIGYLRNFVNVPLRRRFWGEIGYDATYENLNTPTAVMGANCSAAAMNPECWRFVHLARLFLGFEEHATQNLDLTAGVEGLMNVLNPADFRINGTVALASKLGDDFSLALSLTARYVNQPINGRDSLDTVTLISVIYQRSFESAPPPASVATGGGR
jgi:putative salt-induced outer membrane protein YdiY